MRIDDAKPMSALRNLGLVLAAVGRVIAEKPRMPRLLCTGCGLFYGEPGKVRYGYCGVCWDVWLAEQRLAVAREQRAWQAQRIERFMEAGEVPR